jgi:pyruvate ferredoxin oxidoreductase gamma subunit/2-oxoisovalerate ferredoxin oxidoreductase gamma subunit
VRVTCRSTRKFLRVADDPIRLRCEISAPDDLIVLDATLIGATDVAAGLKPGGLIVVNTERAPEELGTLIGRFRVATVDASGIATARGIGSRSQPIVNTAILGAYAAAAGFPSLDALCAAIREEVPIKPAENVAAAQDAAASVRIASPPCSSPRPSPRPSPSVPQEPAHA